MLRTKSKILTRLCIKNWNSRRGWHGRGIWRKLWSASFIHVERFVLFGWHFFSICYS